jgi:outer membrane protein OmpA-like peptidoglycan-associated protein
MRATTLSVLAGALLLFAAACGGAGLHSADAREERRDCIRLNDADACVDVGDRFRTGDEANSDVHQAYRYYSRACAQPGHVGCISLAHLAATEEAVQAPVEQILEDLERQCRRYSVDACHSLIVLLEDPDTSVSDPDRGQRIRDRLCELGFVSYCFYDEDGDGIDDRDDDCPEEPEDFDGFEDEDGCPEDDNDQDGILDADDACPIEAEDLDGFEDEDGCPDLDNDGDGIPDVDDECPDAHEDFDAFEDEDGCPDLDNDGDGIPDEQDHCPNEAEDYDGFEDDDGCPEEGEGIVALTCDAVEIRENVYFDTASDVIQERSFDLLDQIAGVLRGASYVTLVEVAGHTDDRGDDDYNLDLSDRRARSVVRYLEEKGIATERLRATGYGETQPIDSNDTREGRDRNRRVEFRVLEQDSACAP